MKKTFIFTTVFLSFILSSHAQPYKNRMKDQNEKFIFFAAGPAYLFGDTGGYENIFPYIKDFNPHFIRYELQAGFGQTFYERIGYKAFFQHGNYTGEDGPDFAREYGFDTKTIQINVEAQLIFLKGPFFSTSAYYKAYFSGGIAGSKSYITHTGTSGLHRLTQNSLSIPLAVGFDLRISPYLSVGTEIRGQYFFNDNIEGLAPKGSKSNDLSAAWLFSISYYFSNNLSGFRSNTRSCRCY